MSGHFYIAPLVFPLVGVYEISDKSGEHEEARDFHRENRIMDDLMTYWPVY